MAKFIYDDFTDNLIISAKKKSDIVKGSAKLGNIVLDFTPDGRIVNIEIIHVSDFFKNAKVGHKINELTNARLSVQYKSTSIMIWINLKFGTKEEQRLPLIIPTETPKLAYT